MKKPFSSRMRIMWRILRLKFRMMLSLDVSPKVMAKASFMGMFIGLSPYVGTHTYLALLCAGYMNLPIYPLMLGAYITNPITIPFIYAFTTKVGLIVLGQDDAFSFDWHHITISSLLDAGKSLIIPFFVGTHLVGLICAVITYFVVYFVASIYQKHENKKHTDIDK